MAKVYNNTDKSLNTSHISQDNYKYYEAARSAFFVLNIDKDQLGNLIDPTHTGDPSDASAPKLDSATIADSLRFNVIKCPVPHFKVETAEYRRGNDVVRFATVPTWEGGQIVVDDVVGLDTKAIVMAWLYLAYNPHTRIGGRMKDYKKVATLIEYTQDYEQVRSWEIEGIFITGITEGEFDRENDSKRQITIDFTFDRAVLKSSTPSTTSWSG